MEVASIHVYPVKSCRGIAPDRWRLGARGLDHDRQFMVVDPAGRFITGRELPRLTVVAAALEPDTLVLSAPDAAPLRVPLASRTAERVAADVWKDTVLAEPAGAEADEWITRVLGTPARLVRFADDEQRQVDLDFARAGDQVGFADAFSLLVVSEGSLEALNARLPAPVGMHRFRPNLVVRGCPPFAEDGWTRVRVGAIELEIVKPCARCVMTTIDETGAAGGVEPLRTLAAFRRHDGKVMFGQNAIHRGEGAVAIGDPVVVL